MTLGCGLQTKLLPLMVNGCAKFEPSTGLGETPEMLGTAGLTASVSTFDVVNCGLLLSPTVIVTLKVPDAVGVPKGAPVEALIAIPLGKPVADQV